MVSAEKRYRIGLEYWQDAPLLPLEPRADRNCYWMAAIPIAMTVVSSVIQAQGQAQAGQAAANAGVAQQQAQQYQAQELEQQAGQTRAVSQRQAISGARETALTLSAARARAAASGGAATDPGVVTLEQGIAARGEYNTLAALSSGEERARGMENQSTLDLYQGEQYATAGKTKQSAYNTNALSSIFSTAGSLYSKYGMSDTPSGTPNAPNGYQTDAYAMGGYGT